MKNYEITIAFILLLCSLPAAAAIYKCTDENGAVQFGDIPCDKKLKTIKPLKSGADLDKAERNQKRDRLLRAYDHERREKQQQAAEAAAEQAKRKKNCNIVRRRLQQIVQSSSLYNVDDEGNRVNLTDAERARETTQAQADVDYWCN